MREWFTAAELAQLALPGLPATQRGVNDLAKRKRWSTHRSVAGTALARRRQGRGGGFEYHYTVLPKEAQLKLVADSAMRAGEGKGPARSETGTGEVWAWFERLPETRKAKARERLDALDRVEHLVRGGMQKNTAVFHVARQVKKSARSIWNWYDLVAGRDRKDWLPYLAPQHQGRQKTAECSPEAWEAFKAGYLRKEQPTAEAAYEWTLQAGEGRGWTVPALRTLMRRLDAEIPKVAQVLARQGLDAAKRMYPAQERDRTHFHALEAVNADGHKMDVWVTMPDGTEIRPTVIAIQDLYSNKILGWRVDKAPTSTGVRLAFFDVFKTYGIPDYAYLDNGREFAAKMITGGQATRFRFKVSPEEMSGVLTQLGVEVHWTTPYSGQSKPIERAFREFCDRIAKHPALAGAYAGNSPTNKPDYKPKAIDFDTFIATLESGVNRYNEREGRRTKVCQGRRSFDEAFAESYERAPIKKAGPEQLRMAMLAAEQVTARQPDGSVHLFDNRYWSELLPQHIGQKLTLRFDPDALHEGVHIYRADDAYLGFAECWESAGFNSVDAARDQGRKRREYLKAQKQILQLERSMSIDELAAMLPEIDEAPAPETKTVRLVRGANALAAQAQPNEDEAVETGGFDHEAFSRGLTLIDGSRE
ncbi:MAG: transposase domain-containing protein [Marivibrio sp.]|uniref:transposase domain-containing protein n=1 Tax=Marivibrio sp. TaxID=2039719 RepID=UPI0032EECB5B